MYRAGQGRRHAGQQQGQQQQQPPSPLIQLMQFAPLILLLLFSFLSRPSQPVRDITLSGCAWDIFRRVLGLALACLPGPTVGDLACLVVSHPIWDLQEC